MLGRGSEELFHDFFRLFFIAAREGHFFLVDRKRRTDEETADMVGETFIETALTKRLDNLSADRWEVAVVVEVAHILMVRNVSAHCGVA